jgi:adenylate cyclase
LTHLKYQLRDERKKGTMPYIPHDVYEMQQWLLSEDRDAGTVAKLLRGYIERTSKYDIPIDRFFCATFLVHTQLGAWAFKYESPGSFLQTPLEREQLLKIRATAGDDAPMNRLEAGDKFVRIRKGDANVPAEVVGLFQKGIQEMYGLPVFLKGSFSCGITWATKSPGGFTDEHIAFFSATHAALGTIIEFLVQDLVKYSLLCTYLGDDVGSRVHKGSVYRGDLVTIRSVIWFSDIRDFTRISQEMNRNDVIDLINQLWEITEDVLKRHGGEILKFLGDGCLAVFSVPDMSRRSSVFESDDAPVSNARKRLAVDSDDKGGDMTGRDLCQRARRAAHEF